MIRTVVVLDLVRYSEKARMLQQTLGAPAVAAFNARIQGFVDAGLAAVSIDREQAVIKTTGDGAILRFVHADEAHRFAEGVHAACLNHNAERPGPQGRMDFRIGAATGEVASWGTGGADLGGMAIAEATRLESAGKPGQLLIDRTTFQNLSPILRARYGRAKSVHVKRDRIEAYACDMCGEPPRSMRWLVVASAAASLLVIAMIWSDRAGSGEPQPLPQAAAAGMPWLYQLNNPAPGFTIDVATVDGRTQYVEGEPISFVLTADRECHVVLFCVGSDGDLTLLLPNAWQEDTRLSPGDHVVIPPADGPFTFRAKPPHGQTHVKAIATTRPIRIAGIGPQQIREQGLVPLGRDFGSKGIEVVATDPSAPAVTLETLAASEWTTAQVTLITSIRQ